MVALCNYDITSLKIRYTMFNIKVPFSITAAYHSYMFVGVSSRMFCPSNFNFDGSNTILQKNILQRQMILISIYLIKEYKPILKYV
jgi:hypothetical protein